MKQNLKIMTPKQIVAELDKYIIGQSEAKKSVAIALRNRYRRSQLSDAMREEITPKNILMMGPTGVGKTEIARRLAKIMEAPFVKVEALLQVCISWKLHRSYPATYLRFCSFDTFSSIRHCNNMHIHIS